MPGQFLTFLLTLFSLFAGSDPVEANSGDTGPGLEPNG
jgi:hypothetical protein